MNCWPFWLGERVIKAFLSWKQGKGGHWHLSIKTDSRSSAIPILTNRPCRPGPRRDNEAKVED